MKKLLFFLIILLAGTAMSAYYPYYFTGNELSSVVIIKYCITTPAWDTTTVNSFPVTDSFAIDSTQDYSVFYHYYYTGDTLPSLVSQFSIKGTASTTSDTLAIARAVTRDIVDTASVRTDVFYGPSALTGNTYTHYVKIIDTSATPDSTLAYIYFSIENMAGSNVGGNSTNGLGCRQITLDSGSYVFKMFHPLYTAANVTDTITTNGDTTVIRAYDTHAMNTCRVWGYIIGPSGDSINRALVEFTIPPGVDTVDDGSVLLGRTIRTMSGKNNVNGYFEVDLIRSSQLGDKEYAVKITSPQYGRQETTFLVPDSASAKLRF